MPTDWQLVAPNGLTFGPGTPYGITSVAGWLDLPGVRTLDQAKTVGSGVWNGADYADSRVVDVGFDITLEGDTTFADAVSALGQATQVSSAPAPWRLTLPGRAPETIYAKVRGRKVPAELEYEFGLTSAAIQLSAPDPRRFGDVLTASTGLPSTSGGITVPFTVPFTITSTVDAGQVTLYNPGDATGPVTAKITGPCQGPIITHVASGLSLVFSSSLTLDAGQFVVIDMEAHTVLAQGNTGRAQWVTSRGWSGFDPGENTWAFSALHFDPSASLTISATPAWA